MTSTTSIMTTREFLTAVIGGTITDKEIAKAKEMLTALDARNEKRKSADSKEKKEVAERREQILTFLKENADKVLSRDEIATALDNGITASQVSSACAQFIKDGLVEKSNVKVNKATKVVYQYKGE